MKFNALNFAGRVLSLLKRFFLAVVSVLWKAEVPLIITIALAVLAAVLSPHITEKYERQRMSSEYVLGNLRELNTLISDVYVDATAINYAVASGQGAPEDSVSSARKTLAKLNWKIIETAAMLPKNQRVVLHKFQNDVSSVNHGLDQKLDLDGCRELLEYVDAMGLSGARSIQTIGRHVDLTSPPSDEADH